MPSKFPHLLLTLAAAITLIKALALPFVGAGALLLIAMLGGNWVMDKDHRLGLHRNALVTHGVLPMAASALLVWLLFTQAGAGNLAVVLGAGWALGMATHLFFDHLKDWVRLPGKLESFLLEAFAVTWLAWAAVLY